MQTEFPGFGTPLHSAWYNGNSSQVTLTPLDDATGFHFVIEGIEPVKWSENLASRPIRLKAQGFP